METSTKHTYKTHLFTNFETLPDNLLACKTVCDCPLQPSSSFPADTFLCEAIDSDNNKRDASSLNIINWRVDNIFPALTIEIEEQLKKTLFQSGFPNSPCRCFDSEKGDGLWIGCTGKSMPLVFDSLKAMPEDKHTDVNKLHVWDSSANIVPKEFLQSVRIHFFICNFIVFLTVLWLPE